MEQVAMCDEAALEHFLETGEVAEETIRRLISGRRLFPCCFGSALKLEGVEELLGYYTTAYENYLSAQK